MPEVAVATQQKKPTHQQQGNGPRAQANSPMVAPTLVVLSLAAVAQGLGPRFPLLGAPVLGLLGGLALRNTLGIGRGWDQPLRFFTKPVLQLAIILVGATLTLQQAALLGREYVGLIAMVILVTQLGAYAAGRFLGVPKNLATLIGAGTSVCGVTAIMSIGPLTEAKEEEITYSVTTILLFNLLATVLFPIIGHALALPQIPFGAWAGAAIHDTSSVLAVAFGYGDEAGQVATVVKLTRTLFLIPLVLAFAVRQGMGQGVSGGQGQRWRLVMGSVPKFIFGFLLLSLLASAGVLSPEVSQGMGTVAKLLITVVLVAVGLGADLRRLKALGLKPIVLGFLTSAVAAVLGLVILGSGAS